MSQAGIIDAVSIPVPAITFVEDSGAATPVANILGVVTPSSGAEGITTTGAGGVITISLTDRLSGTATTVGAVTANPITFALGAVPGTYTFDFSVAGYDAINSKSVGYTVVGTVRTTGAAGTFIAQQKDQFEEAGYGTGDATIAVAANNALVTVTGVAATTINWKVVGNYTFVS